MQPDRSQTRGPDDNLDRSWRWRLLCGCCACGCVCGLPKCQGDCATTRFDLKVRSANIYRTQSHGNSNKSHRRPCLQSSSSTSSRTTSNCEERSLSSAADSSMRNACTSSPQSGSSPPVISKPTVPKSSIEVKRMARKSANTRSEVA